MAVQRIRFLHCADIHLDFPFCDRGSEGYSDRRRQDVRNAFESIIRLAGSEKLDFVLISGDLFEHGHTPRSTIEWVSGLFRTLSVPVALIPGNHDPYAANSWYKIWEWPDNVVILSAERPSVTFDHLDTYLYGIGFSAFNQEKPDLSSVKIRDPGLFNILMFHGTLDMDMGKPYNPASSEELSALGFDYYALGHFHNRMVDLKIRNAANPGSPEPLGFDEKGRHGVFIVTLERGWDGSKKLGLEICDTARREYVEPVLDITPFKHADEIKSAMEKILKDLEGDRYLTRLVLKGRTSCTIDEAALERELSAGRLYLRIRNDARHDCDYQSLACENTLKGAFVREMLARIKKCEENGDSEQFPILTSALELGLEALEDGRIETDFT